MKTMMDEKLLRTALEVERALTPEEATRLADFPELAALRREAEAFAALPVAAPEVPSALSDQIRAAARRHNTFRPVRARKRKILIPVAGAAALLLGFGLVFLGLPSEKLSETTQMAVAPSPVSEVDKNLLSLADWSKLDQEAYNLSFELNSRQFAVSESMNLGDVL